LVMGLPYASANVNCAVTAEPIVGLGGGIILAQL
jgi:hypothetical protein